MEMPRLGATCLQLPDERVFTRSNCSRLTKSREHDTFRCLIDKPDGAGLCALQRNPRTPLDHRVEFAQFGHALLRHGSGKLSFHGPMIMMLSQLQLRIGLSGAVGEIGVHHGMFAIAVAQQAQRGEVMVAADLFDMLQALNVDKSGSGNLRKFLRNMNRFGIDRAAIDVREGLSSSLPATYPLPLRLFSVDGGHTTSITASDLAWASCNALDGAIIILDDWMNPGAWLAADPQPLELSARMPVCVPVVRPLCASAAEPSVPHAVTSRSLAGREDGLRAPLALRSWPASANPRG